MDITIRNEKVTDYAAVEELTREAFWNLNVPGCDEHYLVHRMRSHPDFIRELDFVAEYRGRIVGNIMYTRSRLTDEQGAQLGSLTFGPLSVLPGFQRQGIGSALISHTRRLAAETGAKAVVILGDPHNYCRHGFKSCRDFEVRDHDGNFPYGMLVLELREKALAGHTWTFAYSDVYEVDVKEAEEFDKKFPEKEKGYRYTQDLFSIAVRAYVK